MNTQDTPSSFVEMTVRMDIASRKRLEELMSITGKHSVDEVIQHAFRVYSALVTCLQHGDAFLVREYGDTEPSEVDFGISIPPEFLHHPPQSADILPFKKPVFFREDDA